jgi:hypothetical protein
MLTIQYDLRDRSNDVAERTPEQLRRRAAELRLQARSERDTDMAIILYRAAQAFDEAGARLLLDNRPRRVA